MIRLASFLRLASLPRRCSLLGRCSLLRRCSLVHRGRPLYQGDPLCQSIPVRQGDPLCQSVPVRQGDPLCQGVPVRRGLAPLPHLLHLPHLLYLLSLLSLLSLLPLLSSCDRRLLEELDYNYALLRIDVDWDTHFTETPSGMTVMLFDSLGLNPNTSVTNNIRSTTFTLGPGHYQAVTFNQSFDEFGSMRFEHTGIHHDIAARATNIVTHQNADWDRGVTYMREPEAIGVALDTFTVTRDMLSQYITLRPHQPITRASADSDSSAATRSIPQPDTGRPVTRSIPQLVGDGMYAVQEVVYPMTSTLYINVHVRGRQNLRAIEGSISGMADGFYLSRVWRTEDTGILLLDNWKTGETASDGSEGWFTTSIPTFGLPHGKELESQRAASDNIIHLHVTLRDGSTREYEFEVGKDIKYRNADLLGDDFGQLLLTADITTLAEVILELDLQLDIEIDLPDVEPSGTGGGGFDAHVDEWEDGGTIDIGF